MAADSFADPAGLYTARLQITDILYAYAHGIDRCDERVVLDCFHEGATWQEGSGEVGSVFDFVANRRSGGNYLATTHYISNVIVRLEGKIAHSQCCYLAYHLIGPEGIPRVPLFPPLGSSYAVFAGGR